MQPTDKTHQLLIEKVVSPPFTEKEVAAMHNWLAFGNATEESAQKMLRRVNERIEQAQGDQHATSDHS